jgi:hypothetical protein
MALSLSIAHIETQKSPKSTFGDRFTDVLRKLGGSKEPPLRNLPLQEYIYCGWDETNQMWCSVVWPSLDKDFRNTDLETPTTGPVWKLGWNARDHEEDVSDESEEVEDNGREHDVVDGNPFGLNKGKGMEQDMGVETPGSGPSTAPTFSDE